MKNYLKFLFVALLFTSCGNDEKDNYGSVEVSQETLGNHIKQFASDEFLGRKPFTEGEVKTVNYLKDEFEKLGVLPGNGDSYFQDVPLVEIAGTPSKNMVISGNDNNIKFATLRFVNGNGISQF